MNAIVVVHALLLVVTQAVVEDVGLERIVDGIERLHERPEPFEVGLAGVGVGLQFHLVLRRQLGEVQVDERHLVPQGGLLLQQFVHLRQGQALVDLQAAETAAVAVLQVGDDQVHQTRAVRTLKARQEVAALVLA